MRIRGLVADVVVAAVLVQAAPVRAQTPSRLRAQDRALLERRG
ncbi:MAG: hypothetical protein ACT4P5_08695 [Armatimonadota bacterium]